MLSLPETADHSQWKAASVRKNLPGKEKLRCPPTLRTALIKKGRSLLCMFRMEKLFVTLATLLALVAPSHAQTKSKPAETGMTPLERRASLNLEAGRSHPHQL